MIILHLVMSNDFAGIEQHVNELALQQMESNGFTYYPGEQGQGGKFIHKDQNFA